MNFHCILLTPLFYLFGFTSIYACDCMLYSLCEWLSEDVTVVEVEVLNKYAGSDPLMTFVDVKVNEFLHGADTLSNDTLTIVDYGSSCDVFIHEIFDVSDRLVVAFDSLMAVPDGHFPAFNLFYCKSGYLSISGDSLSGNLGPFTNTHNYAEFKEDINDTCDSLLLISSSDEAYNGFSNNISVQPNPTSDYLKIQHPDIEKAEFKFFNFSGTPVLSGQLANRNHSDINMGGLPSGIYLLQIKSRTFSWSQKIIKQ